MVLILLDLAIGEEEMLVGARPAGVHGQEGGGWAVDGCRGGSPGCCRAAATSGRKREAPCYEGMHTAMKKNSGWILKIEIGLWRLQVGDLGEIRLSILGLG